MTKRVVRQPSQYTPEQVDSVLLELALTGGNSNAAARNLAARGFPVPQTTINLWMRKTHLARYEEVKARLAPMVEADVVRMARGNARKAAEVADELLTEISAQVKEGKLDAAKAFQQVSVGMGIQVDKTLLLEGRPTEILETRDTQQLLKDLKAIAPSLVVDSTATEVEPAQIPASAG